MPVTRHWETQSQFQASASIYFTISVFLIATNQFTLVEMSLNLFDYLSEMCREKLSSLEIRQARGVFYKRLNEFSLIFRQFLLM
jgi:hypothetical protein